MYDIEVIDNASYAVIAEGSPAYEFLKAMNTQLMLKKLAGEAGQEIYLTTRELIPLCHGFRVTDLRRLVDVDLLEYHRDRNYNFARNAIEDRDRYTFTEYGLEVMKHLKEFGGDVEILL